MCLDFLFGGTFTSSSKKVLFALLDITNSHFNTNERNRLLGLYLILSLVGDHFLLELYGSNHLAVEMPIT